MTTFLRLLEAKDKPRGLREVSNAVRAGTYDERAYFGDPIIFRDFPGASFAYWVSEAVRYAFRRLPAFDSERRTVKQGLATADDFRFVRVWWEVSLNTQRWCGFVKGGEYSPYYSDVSLVVDWFLDGRYLRAERATDRVYTSALAPSRGLYFRPGLTWSSRTKSRLSMRVMPKGCIFGAKGPAVIASGDGEGELFSLLALCSSSAFYKLVEVQLAAADAHGGAAHSFEVGIIQHTPLPELDNKRDGQLSHLARRAWSLKRTFDTTEETSHAFLLPAGLRARLGDYDPPAIKAELARIQAENRRHCLRPLCFVEAERGGAQANNHTNAEGEAEGREVNNDDSDTPSDENAGLLSWAIGVAFGRFDWRLATGERAAPHEPEPLDLLPAFSPGMLLDGTEPYHRHDSNPGR